MIRCMEKGDMGTMTACDRKRGDLRQKEVGPATQIASTGPAVAQVGAANGAGPGKTGGPAPKAAGPATQISGSRPAVAQVPGANGAGPGKTGGPAPKRDGTCDGNHQLTACSGAGGWGKRRRSRVIVVTYAKKQRDLRRESPAQGLQWRRWWGQMEQVPGNRGDLRQK